MNTECRACVLGLLFVDVEGKVRFLPLGCDTQATGTLEALWPALCSRALPGAVALESSLPRAEILES